MKINLVTSNKYFSEIIGNSKQYEVPKYQRSYSWESEQLEDLWDDLEIMYNNTDDKEREEHYMGYLVLKEIQANKFEIIDGQQRITTLTLLALAVLQILKKQNEKDNYFDDIKRNIIIYRRMGTLTEEYKLKLNKNNNDYYEEQLVSLNDNLENRNLTASNKLLRKAKEFFEKKLKETAIFQDESKEKLSPEKLGSFLDIVFDGLLFTVITVRDYVNAYKIFETLNARGVELSIPDLLKNYLFSVADKYKHPESLIEKLENKWHDIIEILEDSDFTNFVRVQWNSLHKFNKKADLFKTIRNEIKEPKDAKNYIIAIHEDVDAYVSLQNYKDNMWKEYTEEVKECIHMFDTFNIVQPLGALLRAYKTYLQKEFEGFCKYLLAFCMRYNVICNLPPNQLEPFYSKLSHSISKKPSLNDIKMKFKKSYVDDDQFKDHFIHKDITNSKRATCLFSALENHISDSDKIHPENYILEHILPKKALNNDPYWGKQFPNSIPQNIGRLGNLTLLRKKDNKKAGNNSFHEKKKIYKTNGLKISEKICEYEDWNHKSILDYQHWLADIAVKKWKIQF